MNIVMISSEAAPFSKTGGLADIVGQLSLSYAADTEHDTRLIVPAYKISKEYFKRAKKLVPAKTFLAGVYVGGDIYEIKHPENEKLTVYFIANDDFFDRDGMYMEDGHDYDDNVHRFTFFAKAAVYLLNYLYLYEEYIPSVVHLHDWHVAIIAFYIKYYYKESKPFGQIKVAFTIHNIAYQGMFDKHYFNLFGISWDYYNSNFFEYYGKISLLKVGILCSDYVTTVSPNYAKEVQTKAFGCGLENILRLMADKKQFCGILNGVSYDKWSPEMDQYLGKNKFSYQTIDKKYTIKKALLKEVGFDLPKVKDKILISMIARFDVQKGINLIDQMMFELSTIDDAVFIFLLSKPSDTDVFANKLKTKFARAKNMKLILQFSERLAHLITASSDIFLMPSRFEPCGLNQMYSMAYGTIPIVYEVGGLKDTVHNYSNKASLKCANGFSFDIYSGDSFVETIESAVSLYHQHDCWNKLIKNAMSTKFPMETTAKEYIELYEKLKFSL